MSTYRLHEDVNTQTYQLTPELQKSEIFDSGETNFAIDYYSFRPHIAYSPKNDKLITAFGYPRKVRSQYDIDRDIAISIPPLTKQYGFNVSLEGSTDIDIQLTGMGLNEQASEVPSLELIPQVPNIFGQGEITLTLTNTATMNSETIYFNLDYQSHISNVHIRKTLGGVLTDIPLDPRYFSLVKNNHIKLITIKDLIDWGNNYCYIAFDAQTHENNRNWVYSVVYGDDVNGNEAVLDESITYFDALGRARQSQSKNLSAGRVLAVETVYDAFGRPVLNTLPAPVGTGCGFGYSSDFITNPSGQAYSYTDFDLEGSTRDNPLPVNAASQLGKYYSDNNTDESHVSTTSFPYSRGYVSKGGVSISGEVGENHRLGSGHENKGMSFPVLSELDAYAQSRHTYMGGTAITTLKYQVVKQVGIDENGRMAVAFVDLSGNTIVSCLSGPEGGVTQNITAETDPDLKYIDVHIPQGQHGSLSFSNTGTYSLTIWNLETDAEVYSGTSGGFPGLSGGGFYRIANVGSGSDGQLAFSYNLDYYNFQYNYYDKVGRLKAEVQPVAISNAGTITNTNMISTYTYHSWYGGTLDGDSPDEGTSEFVYREDGKIRFSQDAEQATSGKYAYTIYDESSHRMVEMGVVDGGQLFEGHSSSPSGSSVHSIVDQVDGLTGAKSEQTYVSYDRPDDGLATALSSANLPAEDFQQTFLLGLASKTWNDHTVTWYSYDELGRLTWTVQEVTGLGVFTVEYSYDFQGNLLEAIHNRYRTNEAVYHQYQYDRDGRMLRAFFKTVEDAEYEEQAEYAYYLHGPLKREELVDDLQGIDYTYTTRGQLKTINHPGLSTDDPGGDGYGTSTFAADIFGLALDYHDNDYQRTGINIDEQTSMSGAHYNGLIHTARWQTKGETTSQLAWQYNYDHRYQLSAATYGRFSGGTFQANVSNDYKVSNITYDKNGNIQSLNRNAHTAGASGLAMDQLTYGYDGTNPNRLLSLTDQVSGSNYTDLQSTGANNYEYNNIGKLTINHQENVRMAYDAYGQIKEVYEHSTSTLKVSFIYDEGGHRLKKHDHLQNITTWYIRDAGGNIVSTYEDVNAQGATQIEAPIYAASRIGIYYKISDSKLYELTDHLGNVRAILEGEKDANGDAVLAGYADYYPFGWTMPGRNLTPANRYRFGYQGIEQDPETGWNAFTLRQYDARLGRWFNPDPMGQYYSPYLAMGNNPVSMVDPTGGFSNVPLPVLTSVGGAIVGGLVGAFTGQPGQRNQSALKGMAIGAAVGLLAGFAVNGDISLPQLGGFPKNTLYIRFMNQFQQTCWMDQEKHCLEDNEYQLDLEENQQIVQNEIRRIFKNAGVDIKVEIGTPNEVKTARSKFVAHNNYILTYSNEHRATPAWSPVPGMTDHYNSLHPSKVFTPTVYHVVQDGMSSHKKRKDTFLKFLAYVGAHEVTHAMAFRSGTEGDGSYEYHLDGDNSTTPLNLNTYGTRANEEWFKAYSSGNKIILNQLESFHSKQKQGILELFNKQ